MTVEQAREKLKALCEEHLLRCYKELSGEERALLLDDVEKLDPVYLDAFRRREEKAEHHDFSPIRVMKREESEARAGELGRRGAEAARQGKLAAVLLAGGSGTRLGASGPKGTYDIGVTRPVYIFQRVFENLEDACRRIGAKLHLFIMTSGENREATEAFLREHAFFGYDEAFVHFFTQEAAPCVDEEGHVLLASPCRIASSPNGNGGWFVSLLKAGYGALLREEGIEWLNVFAVDNVLQRICDPVFFGAVLESGCESGAKVVRKSSPEENVGVICLDGGRTSVIEYYEVTEDMRREKLEDGSYAYYYGVILNYLFHVGAMQRALDSSLPIHFAHKKIPYLDDSGVTVTPESPNGWKFEYFIFDILGALEGCLPFEVEREREFAPVKNAAGPDSVETARELLRLNGIEI